VEARINECPKRKDPNKSVYKPSAMLFFEVEQEIKALPLSGSCKERGNR